MKIAALLAVITIAVLLVLTRSRKSSAYPASGIVENVKVALTPCPDEIGKAVLDALWPKFQGNDYNYLSIWLSRDYSEDSWKPRLDAEQAQIDSIRKWAAALEDRCVRNEYSDWLDHYQRGLDSAWRELRTHAEKDHMDDYDRRNKAEAEAVRKYKESNPLPMPPAK